MTDPIKSTNSAPPTTSVSPVKRPSEAKASAASSLISAETADIHKDSKIPVINLGHLQEYFASAEGEKVGTTQIRDKTVGKNIDVDVIRVTNGDEETYKFVSNGEVIAFRKIKIDRGTEADKTSNPQIISEFLASKDPNRYGAVLERFNELLLERLEQIEKSESINLKGMQLVSSWNCGQSHKNQGLHIEDRTGIDTKSARKCDQYIQEQIEKAGSAEKANTESLGCITMYLPRAGRRQWKKEIKKNPIFKDNTFNEGTVKLTKNDGSKVTAKVIKIQNPDTKMDLYKIVDEKDSKTTFGSILVNPMKVEDAKVKDYCGTYNESSPFSQYGNGTLGMGAKKPQSKVFVEIHETLNKEFKDLNKALFQIPMEIAHKDKEFEGRVMVEGDWNEHANFYEMGFRTQKYRGITKASELEAAYKTEIETAQKERRIANLKQFGSQLMTMSKAEMLEKFKHTQPILTQPA